MNRLVEPEWLDELPPSDPRAVGSRRDLRRVNFWMGNGRTLQRALAKIRPCRWGELGAGDGAFMLRQAKRGPWRNIDLTLIDRIPGVSPFVVAQFKANDWRVNIVTADVFDALEECQPFDIITTNLFLHHFAEARLAALLRLISEKTKVLMACEPRRCRRALWAMPLIRLLGCNEVTRKDAALSIRAGFRGHELSSRWPGTGWQTTEKRAGLFGHLFLAQRVGTSIKPSPPDS